MDSFDVVFLVGAPLVGTMFVIYGALGWMGKVSASSWARWTRANREGGRNQLLLGLIIGMNGVAAAVPGTGFGPLSALLTVAMVGFLALSILHRRKYGPRPRPGERYSSKRLAG
ncbi:hypothetical protein CDG81_04500 [Actinopolyspora erythraea]|uniref:DUF3784 domain-containing protein n=1 Tax=Actinopolyspora erythraea TaxID=414996 RepID=A0A099D442_9ACTN|nr:hypothetical protein [Actinopolyspora erythraea]ASU77693.1 hypothetical protein CDG81_04500 [Actinopolyspora erythraea]KGI80085.1 hypothetical protein IL38_19480 [Actinopolyspora erythraea]